MVGKIDYLITGCPTTSDSLTLQRTASGYDIVGGEANRLSNLKVGLISLLADGTRLDERNKIGIGKYPEWGGRSGTIDVPSEALTLEHRMRLLKYIASLLPSTSTPSANAYAEAGAYMMGTVTSGGPPPDGISGFNFSHPDTKQGSVYRSPITAKEYAQCGADGYGIFFLTDGEPNNATINTVGSMNASLNGSNLSVPSSGTYVLSGEGARHRDNGWGYIGEYSKLLRDINNPQKQEVRTATVGFGGVFSGFKTKTIKVPDGTTGDFKDKIIPDCNAAPNVDAKNLCLWGEYPSNESGTGGLGNGGFTSTGDATALANAVTDFISDLTSNNSISTSPSGSIVIPDDPYSALSQQPIAYMPVIQPDLLSRSSAWQGNLKKYQIENGTFYGKNNVRLYADSNNGSQIRGISLNSAAVDLWSSKTDIDNSQVTTGGVYSNIKPSQLGNDTYRTVFIEDVINGTSKFRQFGVNALGELLLDGEKLSTSNTFGDTALYTVENINHLLSFMGYNGMPDNTPVAEFGAVIVTPSGANPKLGGVLHGTPSLISYSATLDNDGAIDANGARDDYVLFGSMNGALHLAHADDFGVGKGGQEKFVIIPKIMLKNQPKALSMSDHIDAGKPSFGVDAPWLVTANYVYDFNGRKIKVGEQPKITTFNDGVEVIETATNRLGGLHVFGGFRLGAKGLYSIDLTETSADNPVGIPKLNFNLMPDTANFERIGYIWQKPTLARIKINSGDKYGTDVLVFGGGYDMCYEDEAFQVGESTGKDAACNTKVAADGNAVYIVNAKTGELIWSASSSYTSPTDAKLRQVDTMTNSIVGSIEVLDRNNDGYMDHLYFADLGGQVFRADFTNSGDRIGAGATSPTFRNHRVIRVLHESGEGKYKRRFYEKPVVDFYADSTGGTFGLVMVSSGDRSSPLSKMRTDNNKADRLYSIFDYDLTLPNSQMFATTFTSSVANTTASNMVQMGTDTTLTIDKVKEEINKGKKGWYYPLFYFEGYQNVLYNKTMGKSEVVRGFMQSAGAERSFLYTTMYNPDMSYSQVDVCSARVAGGSERQFYCLPYGICDDNAPLAGYQRAGVGIQELAFGPASSDEADRGSRVLISSMLASEHTSAEYAATTTYLDQAKNADGTISQTNLTPQTSLKPSAGLRIDENFSLTPKRWYELSSTSSN